MLSVIAFTVGSDNQCGFINKVRYLRDPSQIELHLDRKPSCPIDHDCESQISETLQEIRKIANSGCLKITSHSHCIFESE